MKKILLLGVCVAVFGTALFAWGNARASNHQQDWCPKIDGSQSDFIWDENNSQYGTVTVEKAQRKIVGGLVPCGRACDDPTTRINEATDCDFCHFFALFNTVINWVITKIVPTIALLFIVIGGFLIATSRGNPGQSQKGKDMLIWTFVGIAVISVGWMVLNSLLANIGIVEWTGLQGGLGKGWWQFSCGT